MNLPIKKNETYEMLIEDLGSNGEGIGRIEGFTVFVEGALIGEEVSVLIMKLKKQFAFGKLIEILKPSAERVEAVCPVAKWCGGCQLQHLSYAGQLAYKTKKTQDALERIGKLEGIQVLDTIGMEDPWHYRNKAQVPVGGTKSKEGNNEIAIGFYAKHSHRIINADSCYLQQEKNTEVLAIVRKFLEEFQIKPYNEETGKGTIRHILTRTSRSKNEMMICFVVNGNDIPQRKILVDRLKEVDGVVSIVLNENRNRNNVIMGEKVRVLHGKDTISDSMDGLYFDISALSFYQVNPVQTEILYGKALELADLKGEEIVLDLYCGIGTISLFLARKVKKVYGVEIIPQAIEDAKKNALNNQIDNVEFLVGDASDVVVQLQQERKIEFDVIVVDPPRKGCDKMVLDTIVQLKPKTVIYVSCNPATLARDVVQLKEAGYEVEEVQAVDQFPMTIHVEAVLKMSLQE